MKTVILKTVILAPALALAALSLAACGPRADTGNTANDTLTLNEEGDAGLANSDAFEATGNDVAIANDSAADNLVAPAEGNAL